MPAGCVWTQKEIAEAFNVSLRAIGNWVSKEMPKEPEGYYNLVKICYWKMADEADKTSEEDWGKINKKYQALIHELEYRQLSKKLISREEVDTIFRNRLISLVRSFGALPREIAPAMEGMSIREKEAYLTERIEDIRNQFAEPILEDEEDEEDIAVRCLYILPLYSKPFSSTLTWIFLPLYSLIRTLPGIGRRLSLPRPFFLACVSRLNLGLMVLLLTGS